LFLKKKEQKHKSIVRIPRDDVEVEGNNKAKKSKGIPLTIHKAMNMMDTKVNELKLVESMVI